MRAAASESILAESLLMVLWCGEGLILTHDAYMIIQKKRIRSLPRHISKIPRGQLIVIGTRVTPQDLPRLREIGFGDQPNIGDSVLPAKIGPRTIFNAEGGVTIHKDQPKETAYQTIEWKWEEWHGPHDRVQRSDFRDRSYQRYPRTQIPAPGVELSMNVMADGQRIVVSPAIECVAEEEATLIERINLHLELFGICELFSDRLDELIRAPVHRLNWEVLRSGHWTWNSLRSQLRKTLDQERKGNRQVIEARFEFLNSCNPDFVAVGTAGFAGYVVFGFETPGRYILESIYSDNATYIFGTDWQSLSQMTKTQIIENDLAEKRIAHRRTWWAEMKSYVAAMRKTVEPEK